MDKQLKIEVSVTIHTTPEKVWQALTDKDLIKQYLFGTETHTDWKAGSPITYTGTWEGKAYEDKGTILKFEENKLLQTTYWSSFSGTEYKPENESIVTYEVARVDNGATSLTITQEGFTNQQSGDHSAENWKGVLNTIKKMLEK